MSWRPTLARYHSPVPLLRPFRALRFDDSLSPSAARLICPPYDVISPEAQRELAERHPNNVVRLELPLDGPGDGDDAKYRRAARDLVAWRTQGILRKDRRPAVYVYEQVYRVPGSEVERTQRGFFARLRLEPFGPDSGVRPHERTLSGPKEDRYRLLRATGVNSSPVICLYDSGDGLSAQLLAQLTADAPEIDVADDEGVRHRLWMVPVTGGDTTPDSRTGLDTTAAAAQLLTLVGSGPVTIADGHHRYETALRYRTERGQHRACESDPPYDYILSVFYDIAGTELTVLPTHRLVRGGPAGAELFAAVDELFQVEPCDSGAGLVRAFAPERDEPREASGMGARAAEGAAGTGRFGLWTAGRGAILHADRERFEGFLAPSIPPTLRSLDATLLAVALERVAGIGPSAVAEGSRVGYTKDAGEAVEAVERGEAHAAFLLDPTPVRAVIRVAAEGNVMPQKSTYFYPKAATGLVISPPEW